MAASETRRDHLTIEIDAALRRRIEVAASLKGRSVREYVEEVLTRAVAAQTVKVESVEREPVRIEVPPMTAEERARGLQAIAEAERLSAELFEKYGRFEPEGWVLINEARKERTRQLMEASGMEWTAEDEAAWDDEA